jgi:heat shock protein HslJ
MIALLLCCACGKKSPSLELLNAPLPGPFVKTTTYVGTIPCEDCEQIDIVLNLRPDMLYQLRKTYIGKEGNVQVESQLGRWQYLHEDNLLILGKQKGLLKAYVVEEEALRFVEWQGASTADQIQYRLLETKEGDPFRDLVKLRGLFTAEGPTPTLLLCTNETIFPLARGGDYQALLQNYLNTPHTRGTPLLTSMIGRLVAGPEGEEIQVERFRRIYSDRDCQGEKIQQSLAGTIWHLIELNGTALVSSTTEPSPYLLLDRDRSFEASTGCNTLSGSFIAKGDTLLMQRKQEIRLACPSGLALENVFIEVLEATEGFRLQDGALELLDAAEEVRARFRSGS